MVKLLKAVLEPGTHWLMSSFKTKSVGAAIVPCARKAVWLVSRGKTTFLVQSIITALSDNALHQKSGLAMQGVVTSIRPVEPSATGIKMLICAKSSDQVIEKCFKKVIKQLKKSDLMHL